MSPLPRAPEEGEDEDGTLPWGLEQRSLSSQLLPQEEPVRAHDYGRGGKRSMKPSPEDETEKEEIPVPAGMKFGVLTACVLTAGVPRQPENGVGGVPHAQRHGAEAVKGEPSGATAPGGDAQQHESAGWDEVLSDASDEAGDEARGRTPGRPPPEVGDEGGGESSEDDYEEEESEEDEEEEVQEDHVLASASTDASASADADDCDMYDADMTRTRELKPRTQERPPRSRPDAEATMLRGKTRPVAAAEPPESGDGADEMRLFIRDMRS